MGMSTISRLRVAAAAAVSAVIGCCVLAGCNGEDGQEKRGGPGVAVAAEPEPQGAQAADDQRVLVFATVEQPCRRGGTPGTSVSRMRLIIAGPELPDRPAGSIQDGGITMQAPA